MPGLNQIRSAGVPRQPLDAHGEAFSGAVSSARMAFLPVVRAPVMPLANGLGALDADWMQFDNSPSRNEGVSRRCWGIDSVAPTAADLGYEDRCLELEPSAGSEHRQKDTLAFRSACFGAGVP